MTDRDPRDVAAIAAGLGCAVIERVRQAHGLALWIDCPTIGHKLDLLVALGRYDAERFPDLLHVARRIVARVPYECHARAEALQRWIQAHVGFVDEPMEAYPSALSVLLDGAGDCDDHAIVVVALAHALGMAATAEAFFWPESDGGHVAAQIRCDGDWLWTETTIGATLGEHPIAAARRLGLRTRADIHG